MRIIHDISFDLNLDEKEAVRRFRKLLEDVVTNTVIAERDIIGEEIGCEWDDFEMQVREFLDLLE